MKRNTMKNIPMTKELGYVLLTLVGDGSIDKNNNNVTLSVIDSEFRDKWASVCEQVFKVKVHRKTYGKMFVARFHSRATARWLREKVRPGKYIWKFYKTTFERLKKLSLKELGFALGGYFDAEGTVKDNESVSVCSVNKIGLLQIRELLDCCGIPSRFFEGRWEKRTNRKIPYFLVISSKTDLSRFQELINFTIKRKKQKLANLLQTIQTANKRYSKEAKICAQYLYSIGWPSEDIAAIMGINFNTLQHWTYNT